jgi:hypothetical protein
MPRTDEYKRRDAERARERRRANGQVEDRPAYLERHARERVLKEMLELQTIRLKNVRGGK